MRLRDTKTSSLLHGNRLGGILLTAVGVLIAAVAPAQAGRVAVGSAPPPKKVLRFWEIWPDRGLRAAIHAFETRHPGVTVHEAIYLGTMDAQRLMTAIAGGAPPDLLVADRFSIGSWAQRKAFLPLDKFIAASERDNSSAWSPGTTRHGEMKAKGGSSHRVEGAQPGGRTGIYARNFYRACWQEATYRGQVYGIPMDTDDRLLFYNCNLLKRAGFVNQAGHAVPPKTWKQLEHYAAVLTHHDPYGNLTQLGFAPNYGNSWLYMYAFLDGGRFMNRAGTRVTMDSPAVVRALQFMGRLYDLVGGISRADAFLSSTSAPELDPFLTGRIAMEINVGGFVQLIAQYRPYMEFAVALPPTPSGRHRVTWSGGFAYSIPVGSTHPRTAFQLIQFLVSPVGWRIQMAVDARYDAAQGYPFVPQMTAQPAINRAVFRQYVAHNPNLSPRVIQAVRVAQRRMAASHFRPVTPVGQYLWDQQVQAMDATLRNGVPAAVALRQATEKVQQQLDRILHPPPAQPVPWRWFILAATGAALLAGVVVVTYFVRRKGWRYFFNRQAVAALLFVSPWLVGFLLLQIGPMFTSLVYSFCRYDVLHPAQWVGLHNYRTLFLGHNLFWLSLENTAYMLIGLPLGMAAGLAIALLLNTEIRGMKIYRTLFYLPAIVPVVASSVLWMWVLSPIDGLINSFLRLLGVHHPPLWLASPSWLLGSKAAIILMGLWGAGGGMIIWLAGLKGIPRHLYEAAEIDGAGVLRRFRHVTIPMLTPYIFFNLIMGTIGTMQIFTQAYIMTQGGPANSTYFFGYYLFVEAFKYFRMGYASALAWILLLMIAGLSALQFGLSKKWVVYDTM